FDAYPGASDDRPVPFHAPGLRPVQQPAPHRPAGEDGSVKRLVLVALLLAGTLAPIARADGDPASDYLITYQVFYPYYSNVPEAGLKQLETTVAAANKQGYRIRVAVITSPYDLGSLSSLWQKPQPYCRFLSLELSFAYKGRLLVVSPKGYGYADHTKPVP